MGEGGWQIPGPGSAAFLAAGAPAWAASQANPLDGGGLIRLLLVAATFGLGYMGYRVEKLHTNFAKAKVDKGSQ